MRDEDEITTQIDAAEAPENRNRYQGMTYAQGVSEALRWVLEWQDEAPFGGEDG